ncbi:MAG: cation:proton antiporter [Acetobacteraceae bacterium]|nr:cation:proton antiporter [Acetobacteraceae bacterium]MBV8524973.1 cation:proton antiporter [Acetobacteraceae bacterium]
MYQNAALLAGCMLLYSAIAGRVERSWISGPILFTCGGLLLGPHVLGVLSLDLAADGLRRLAELTLAMVLFTDAANADLGIVRRNLAIPERLLLIGLPLTIVLGFVVARIVFPWLAALEAALLAAMLAPTDAALGMPVVSNRAVPASIRAALNLESGLNDGICVPVVVILLDLAVGTQIQGSTMAHMARVVAEEIGIGLATGLIITACTVRLLRVSDRAGWASDRWLEVSAVGLAAACFAAAQAIGGSGFIACFTGGLLLSALRGERKHELLRGAEATGESLALLTWVAFGASVIGEVRYHLTWPVVLYAVLSLTLIRMLPVFISLAGTGMSVAEKLFIGWFGPRGLASIVFGIIVLNEKLPGNDTMMAAVVCTVLISIVAHGMTATPLAGAMGAFHGSGTEPQSLAAGPEA